MKSLQFFSKCQLWALNGSKWCGQRCYVREKAQSAAHLHDPTVLPSTPFFCFFWFSWRWTSLCWAYYANPCFGGSYLKTWKWKIQGQEIYEKLQGPTKTLVWITLWRELQKAKKNTHQLKQQANTQTWKQDWITSKFCLIFA